MSQNLQKALGLKEPQKQNTQSQMCPHVSWDLAARLSAKHHHDATVQSSKAEA